MNKKKNLNEIINQWRFVWICEELWRMLIEIRAGEFYEKIPPKILTKLQQILTKLQQICNYYNL